MATVSIDTKWFSEYSRQDHFQEEIDSGHRNSSLKDVVLQAINVGRVEGILLFDKDANLVYGNDMGDSILDQLCHEEEQGKRIPEEIQAICKWMNESRQSFKRQNWLMNFKVVIAPLKLFTIHARWIKGKTASDDFLLLRMEDQNQFIRDLALEEARSYGLTDREQEVWLLHKQNFTYKEIAKTLGITPNTVKKHMRSIMTKQRTLED